MPTNCNSQHVSYEEIEMKQIDMLCNPAYAVPSEVIENKSYQGNKMADTEHIDICKLNETYIIVYSISIICIII